MNKKRNIFMSLCAILLAFVMLTGTTLAWFSVTYGNVGTRIEMGTLQLRVLGYDKYGTPIHADGVAPLDTVTNNFALETTPPLICDDLMEPSLWNTKYIKFVNYGSLDLKYTLSFDVIVPNSRLQEVILYRLTPLDGLTEVPSFADDTLVPVPSGPWSVLPDLVDLDLGYEYLDASPPSNGPDYPSVRIYRLDYKMCDWAGNSYQGLILTADLHVSATQYTNNEIDF